MAITLKERLALSGDAARLFEQQQDKTITLGDRLKLAGQRASILEKLGQSKQEQPEEVQVSTVLNTGRDYLESIGVKLKRNFKDLIKDRIDTNEEFNGRVNNQPWNSKRKKMIRDMAATEANSADIYFTIKPMRNVSDANACYNIYKAVDDIHNEAYTAIGQEYRKVVESLAGGSPVNKYQAENMALKSGFDKLVNNRLARQRKGDFTGKGGAGKRKLLDAATEFYQLVAFDAEPVNFTVRTKRQHYSNDDRTINVGEGFLREELHHELAHSIEYDHPEVLEMSKNFLKERLAKSNGIRTLRDIYTDKRKSKKYAKYSKNEYAIDDGAFTPYVTKFYNDADPFDIDGARATEVITMGIQSLANDKGLGRMITNDPEHFEFIVGVIKYLQEKKRSKRND